MILEDKFSTECIGSMCKMLNLKRMWTGVYTDVFVSMLACRFQRKSIDGSFGSSDGKSIPWLIPNPK